MRAMIFVAVALLPTAAGLQGKTVRLDSRCMAVDVETSAGRWAVTDKRSGVRWPSKGTAAVGVAKWLDGGFAHADSTPPNRLRLRQAKGAAVVFEIVGEGRSLEIRYEGPGGEEVRLLGDALGITDTEGGYVVVPCREGLLVSPGSGKAFRRTFGTSDYFYWLTSL